MLFFEVLQINLDIIPNSWYNYWHHGCGDNSKRSGQGVRVD